MDSQFYYVGIDDTDNQTSRGTGYRARQLARVIESQGYGSVSGITRHQLLVSPEIPYTSHNSSACLAICLARSADELVALCRDYLISESAVGSDAGFCIVQSKVELSTVEDFGHRAKREVLTQGEAVKLARVRHCHLEGVTGDHGGIIGALAAVGLRYSGGDGRFIWVRGLRELAGCLRNVRELLGTTGVQVVESPTGTQRAELDDLIELGDWPRAVLREGRITLLVEESDEKTTGRRWRVVSKERIKAF